MKTQARKTTKSTKTSAPMVMTSKTSNMNTTAKAAPTHDEIAKRSYELFLSRGGEAGHEVEDWLRAESELKG